MNGLIFLTERIGHPMLGIIIPAVILAVSIITTWMLYKKFSGKKNSIK
ncbi:MAG: hypothetical protein JXA68_04865 [Ignavibacteriales bacterium]|nr:hypothetical protein [Ignavibacteriales bacterium]